MLSHAPVLHFFLWLKNIPLCGVITSCLPTYQLDGYLGCSYLLAVTFTAAINVLCTSIRWTYGFNSLEYIPKSRIARSYGNSMLNFKETVKLFSTVVASFYIPTSSV